MIKYAIQRIAVSLVLLWVVVTFTFLLLQFVPGDPAGVILGGQGTPAQIAQVRHELGIDRPVIKQYGTWLGNVLHADLGRSVISGQSVSAILNERAPVTISLAIAATLVSVLVGVEHGDPRRGSRRVGRPNRPVRRGPRRGGAELLARRPPRPDLLGVARDPALRRLHLVVERARELGALHGAAGRGRRGGVHRRSRSPDPRVDVDGAGERLRTDPARSRLVAPIDRVQARAAQRVDPDRHGRRLAVRRAVGRSRAREQVFALPGLGQATVQAISTNDIPVLARLGDLHDGHRARSSTWSSTSSTHGSTPRCGTHDPPVASTGDGVECACGSGCWPSPASYRRS